MATVPSMSKRRVSFLGPLDLRATIGAMTAKAAGRPALGPSEALWTTNTPIGPATLHMRREPGALVGEAWGAGADWVLDRLQAFSGLRDNPAAFQPPPGLIAQLHRRTPGLRLGSTGRVFEALVPAVLGQRVTSVEAGRAYRKLVATFGELAPGPFSAWLPPRSDTLARATYADLHPLGVERDRAQVLIEVARRAARLEEVVSMDRESGWARLTAVRGIGPWSAAIACGLALGDPDAVPVGDYHIPNMVAWALAGEPRGDDARMLELLEPYGGQRRRVLILLKSAGIEAPKYGPKTAPRDFSRS